MTKSCDNAVILFARDPVLGQVKTRLSPFLDKKTILELYTCFLHDSLDKIRQVENADLFVGVAPSNQSGFFSGMPGADIRLFVQEGKQYKVVDTDLTFTKDEILALVDEHPDVVVVVVDSQL